MKTEIKSMKQNNLSILLTLKLGKNEILSPNAMNSIRGGEVDGEANGGENIIILTPPKK